MIIVLGGGITGLCAAYQLKKAGKEFLLLEASDRLGGKIQSKNVDGFQLELGPNTVVINNLETKQLLEELNLYQNRIQPDEGAVKNRFVLFNSRLEQLPTGILKAIQSPLLGLKSLWMIISEPFRKRGPGREESLAHFSKRRLGSEIYENFIYPFVAGIYAGDPEKMSIDFTLKLLKQAENEKGSILLGMPNILKSRKAIREEQQLPKQGIFTLKGGLQSLVDSLRQFIGEENISLNSKVLSILSIEKEYQIIYQKEEEEKVVNAKTVISCIPSHSLLSIKGINLNPQLKKLSNIHYVPAYVAHFGFKKGELKFPEKAFGVLNRKTENAPFLGILFNSSFFPHTAPQGLELITVIAGGYQQADLIEKSDEVILAELQKSIQELFDGNSKPQMCHLQRWEKGIPQYELGYSAVEKAISNFEKENPNFYLGGNYSGGISVSDCIQKGFKLAEEIVN